MSITAERLEQMEPESSLQTDTVWVRRSGNHYLVGSVVDGEPLGGVLLARSPRRALVYIKEMDRHAR